MINVSNKFKQALLDDKRQFQIEATITLIDDTELTITNSELWSQGFEIDTSVSGNNSFDIGGLIIGRMTLVINNIYEDYTQYDFFDADVDVTLTLPFDDGTSESIVFDSFIVDEATDNESQIVLTCLDNAKHFERPYSESNLVYPASVNEIVLDACDTCGVPLLTTSIQNGNYVVSARPSNDGLTFLKVVSWCAQLTGNFARINNNGQLVVGWYDINTLSNTTVTSNTITDTEYSPVLDTDDDSISDTDAVTDETTNGHDWTIPEPDASEYHHIVSWSSLTVGTDDVLITGVRVVATSSDNTEFVGFYGSEGYVLEVRGNDLIGVSDVQSVAASIGLNVIGLRFRTYNGACLGDPTIEASDLIWITDRKNRSYRSLICGTCFKLGQYQNLYCGAATPSRHSAVSYSESTRAIVKTRQEIRKSLADYDSRVSSMAELIARGFGMYFTPVTQQDGSVIPYIHDKPTIAESSYIAYMTSQGIMMESDGESTAAVDRNGNALLNTLTARGINADWINSGAISIRDTQGNETFYANCLTGVVRINATSFSLTGSTIQQITQQAVDNIEVGGRNLLLATGTAHTSRSDDPQYTQEYQVTDYGETLFDNTETDFTISFDYELQGDYSSVSDSSQIYAVINGTDASPSNPIYVKEMPANGHYKTTCKLTQAQVASASKTCSARWSGIVSGCTFTVKNFKLETGSVETDWTPAPEDMQSGIDAANSAANSANNTAQQANSTARQAHDIASSAGGLVAYLDNDFQNIPTDDNGNYTTFPECSTQITVFYNSTDVSTQCTYATAVTTGLTGTWDGSTRVYTVTGLAADSGTVTITAAYNNITLSKKFTVIKVRRGATGPGGGQGTAARSYFLDVTPKSIKLGENLSYAPNAVIVNAYYRDGNSTVQTAYDGYIYVEYYRNNSWSQVSGCSVEDSSTFAFTLAHTNSDNVSYSDHVLSLPTTVSTLRVKLKTENNVSATILDQQEIVILIDISALTQEEIFNKLTDDGEVGGLFLQTDPTTNKPSIYVNASYIKTGTLVVGGSNNVNGRLRVLNSSGAETVVLDNTGINAIYGNIAGWKIDNHSLKKEVNDNSKINTMLQCPSGPTSTVLAIGATYNSTTRATDWTTAPFRVTALGKMYATGAEISGKITATDGHIGGWEIKTNSLRNETKGSSNNILIGSTTNNVLSIGATWASGASATDWATGKFRVTKDGSMYANAGYIGNWKITTNSIRREEKDGADALFLCPTSATSTVLSIGAPTVSNSVKWTQAPFYVKGNGALVASSASLTGSLKCSGTVLSHKNNVTIATGYIRGDVAHTETGYIRLASHKHTVGSSNSYKAIEMRGHYSVDISAGNIISFDIGSNSFSTILAAIDSKGFHDYSGTTVRNVILPTAIFSDGGIAEYVTVDIVDGIVK